MLTMKNIKLNIKPAKWKITLMLLVTAGYYYLSFTELTKKCLFVSEQVYTSFSFLVGGCGQTDSLALSILAAFLLALVPAAIYLLLCLIPEKKAEQ